MPLASDTSHFLAHIEPPVTCSRDSTAFEPSRARVLDAANDADRAAWLRVWETWPGREVFAHPSYGQLFARGHDRVCCAVLECPTGGVLFPFLLRPLTAEPWTGSQETAWDLTSPYGYGGPFAWNVSAEQGVHFWEVLESWLRRQDVVSAVARLSLFAEQRLPFRGEIEPVLPNIVRSLDLDAEAVWQDYEYKVRKNVKRARASQLVVEFDGTGQRLDEFLEVYYGTMDRREAAPSYYFPRSFFETLRSQLAGQYMFCHVRQGQRLVSTELVLVSSHHLYSFLGGTVPEAFALRPNDLLKHEVIAWGQRTGKKAFVLGGGHQGEDGIYRYKKSFAPQGTQWFQIGKRVLAPERYLALAHARQAWESRRNGHWQPRPGFFPEYRG